MKHLLVGALTALICVLGISTAEAACETPTTLEALQSESDGAIQAFADFDREALLIHSTRARAEILPCLGETVTVEAATSFHILMALEAFTNGNSERTVQEFHAARRLKPGYEFPEVMMIDEGHPLLDDFERAALVGDGAPEVIYPPEGGYVMVDGVRDAPRPSQTPVIIQVFAPSGTILETGYYQPGDTLPVWGKNIFGVTAEDLGVVRGPDFKNPKPWIVTGVITMAAGGAMYAAAMHQKSQFQDTSRPDDLAALDTHQDLANGFGTASIATGSVGLGLTLTGAVLQIRFGGKQKAVLEPAAASYEEASP